MAYEPRPGSLSLFKNDKKEKESHPDYRGDGLLPDGTPAWISAWTKTSQSGKKFLSVSIQAKDERREPGQSSRTVNSSHDDDLNPLDDDIPF
jgi:hypothetical protein